MKSCVIIGASPCDNLNFIDTDLLSKAFIIAADGGYDTAKKAGLRVNAFIGDIDSNGFIPECEDVTILPCEKDYTDVHTAVNRALKDGYKLIYLTGCTNGRADHYFANVFLLELIAKNGAQGIICDKCNRIRFITEGEHRINKEAKYLSILPLDEQISGVTLKGLKYNLNNATICRDVPIGVSNEWVEDVAYIRIEKGRALLISSEDERI